jgi:hypothetical protein
MIDPTNTEPIPVHRPHIRRVLSLLAIFVLVAVALVVVLRGVDFSNFYKKGGAVESIPVVPPPATGGESIFNEDVQKEFASVQERVNTGKITREEGELLMEEIFKKVPPPVPPAN